MRIPLLSRGMWQPRAYISSTLVPGMSMSLLRNLTPRIISASPPILKATTRINVVSRTATPGTRTRTQHPQAQQASIAPSGFTGASDNPRLLQNPQSPPLIPATTCCTAHARRRLISKPPKIQRLQQFTHATPSARCCTPRRVDSC